MIRVGKFNPKIRKHASHPQFKRILIHLHEPLSPYQLKTEDGYIFENFWQFSKIYPQVSAVNHNNPRQYDYWKHPHEVHIKSDTTVDGVRYIETTPEYWKWREKGFNHYKAVRNPNGHKGRGEVAATIWYDSEKDQWLNIDYITARKKLYYKMYWDKRDDPEMIKLKDRLAKGENIMINEVDGPVYSANEPYCNVSNDDLGLGSIEITHDILDKLINNDSHPFGHGYSIAGVLLGWQPTY